MQEPQKKEIHIIIKNHQIQSRGLRVETILLLALLVRGIIRIYEPLVANIEGCIAANRH